MKRFQIVMAIIASLVVFGGAPIAAYQWFTPRSEFVGFRQEYRVDVLQKWIWQIEDQYGCSDIRPNALSCQGLMPQFQYDQYRRWIAELKVLLG